MKLLAILLGSAWGRIGGSDSQGFRSFGIPLQIAYAKLYPVFWELEPYMFLLIIGYIASQWGAIQAFSYGLSSPIHKLVVKLYKGLGADGNYKPVEYVTRLLCALLWCLPSVFFVFLFGNIVSWAIFYIIGVILIPICGTFIKSAMWNEMLVWGILSLQVLI